MDGGQWPSRRKLCCFQGRPQRFVRGSTCRCPKDRLFIRLTLDGGRSPGSGRSTSSRHRYKEGRRFRKLIRGPTTSYVTIISANPSLEITTGALSASQQLSVFSRSIAPRGSRLNKCPEMVSQRSPWLLAAAWSVWAATAGAQTITVNKKTVGKPRHSRRRGGAGKLIVPTTLCFSRR